MTLRSKFGFSLIELLITVSLVGLVSLAVYSSFQSGVRVAQNVIVPLPQEELEIFFAKFTRDLKNSFVYKDLRFEGTPDRFMFPTAIQVSAAMGGDRGIGRVTYAYEGFEEGIVRYEENMSHLFQEKSGTSRVVLPDVESMEFLYYVFDPVEQKYDWREKIGEKEASEGAEQIKSPVAVQVKVRRNEEGGSKEIVRTIVLGITPV